MADLVRGVGVIVRGVGIIVREVGVIVSGRFGERSRCFCECQIW